LYPSFVPGLRLCFSMKYRLLIKNKNVYQAYLSKSQQTPHSAKSVTNSKVD